MRKFVSMLLLVPLGLLFIVFAVANRHAVMVSFDPLDQADTALGIRLPLFVVIIATAIVGVVAGGVATWLTQRHWRRAAKHHARDAARLRDELASARREVAVAAPLSPGLPVLRDVTRVNG